MVYGGGKFLLGHWVVRPELSYTVTPHGHQPIGQSDIILFSPREGSYVGKGAISNRPNQNLVLHVKKHLGCADKKAIMPITIRTNVFQAVL